VPDTIQKTASEWVGKWFNKGQLEQCMAFVRFILDEANSTFAEKVTAAPVDGLATGFYLASSLAGRDLGKIVVNPEQLNAGDVIFFEDTYDGPWPEKTITHVGVYIGDGFFVHRPTVSRPVERAHLTGYWLDKFRCGLGTARSEKQSDTKLPAPKPVTAPPKRIKVFAHSGRVSVLKDGRNDIDDLEVKLTVHNGKAVLMVDGKFINFGSVSLDITY